MDGNKEISTEYYLGTWYYNHYGTLQHSSTRARRYANYKGGKKYDKENEYAPLERGTGEAKKAESAAIFYKKWKAAEADPHYTTMKSEWKKKLASPSSPAFTPHRS